MCCGMRFRKSTGPIGGRKLVTVEAFQLAVPCLRTLVTSLSPRRPGFDPWIVNVKFVFGTSTPTQVTVRIPQASPCQCHSANGIIISSATIAQAIA
jgi:hypothetical protein